MKDPKKISKGDVVEILPQHQDEGDENYIWVAIDDESKGRVTIVPSNIAIGIKPTYVVDVDWLRKK